MIYLSHVNYVEKRYEFYRKQVRSRNVFQLFTMSKLDFELLVITSCLMIVNERANIEKYDFLDKLRMFSLMMVKNIRQNKWFLLLLFIVFGFVQVLSMQFQWEYGSSSIYIGIYLYVLFATSFLTITRLVVNVLNIQSSTVTENYINLSVGDEPIDLLMSSELAVKLIYEYTDEVIYSIGFSEIIDREMMLVTAANEVKCFIEESHMKQMFMYGGRYFHVAGLIALIDLCYDSIKIDLDKKQLKNSAMNALYEIEEFNSKRVEDLKVLIHDWVYESMYDIDHIESLSDTELMIILVLCKEELLYLKDKYIFYDKF